LVRSGFGKAVAELDIRQRRGGSVAARFLQHGRGHVDPDHPAFGRRHPGGDQAVLTGAAAGVDDRLAGSDPAQGEWIAHSGDDSIPTSGSGSRNSGA
jgi:hypothetical protein